MVVLGLWVPQVVSGAAKSSGRYRRNGSGSGLVRRLPSQPWRALSTCDLPPSPCLRYSGRLAGAASAPDRTRGRGWCAPPPASSSLSAVATRAAYRLAIWSAPACLLVVAVVFRAQAPAASLQPMPHPEPCCNEPCCNGRVRCFRLLLVNISLLMQMQCRVSHGETGGGSEGKPRTDILSVLSRASRVYRACPRWCDRFGQPGIKVSFWGSGTLKIVILVETHRRNGFYGCSQLSPPRRVGGVN
jgi:hypothetical protein